MQGNQQCLEDHVGTAVVEERLRIPFLIWIIPYECVPSVTECVERPTSFDLGPELTEPAPLSRQTQTVHYSDLPVP